MGPLGMWVDVHESKQIDVELKLSVERLSLNLSMYVNGMSCHI